MIGYILVEKWTCHLIPPYFLGVKQNVIPRNDNSYSRLTLRKCGGHPALISHKGSTTFEIRKNGDSKDPPPLERGGKGGVDNPARCFESISPCPLLSKEGELEKILFSKEGELEKSFF